MMVLSYFCVSIYMWVLEYGLILQLWLQYYFDIYMYCAEYSYKTRMRVEIAPATCSLT